MFSKLVHAQFTGRRRLCAPAPTARVAWAKRVRRRQIPWVAQTRWLLMYMVALVRAVRRQNGVYVLPFSGLSHWVCRGRPRCMISAMRPRDSLHGEDCAFDASQAKRSLNAYRWFGFASGCRLHNDATLHKPSVAVAVLPPFLMRHRSSCALRCDTLS